MNEPILSVLISNHPIFTDMERIVNVTMQNANSNAKRFEFWYEVEYKRGGVDISSSLPQPTNLNIYTDVNKKQTVYDDIGNPIENPEWDGESEEWYDRYVWINGWDMIKLLINKPTNITNLIEKYVLINDSEGYFDN